MLVIAIFFIPLVRLVLNKREYELAKDKEPENDQQESGWIVYRMLFRDIRFWLLVPAVLLPAFWATGLFLYQVSIAEQLSWSATLIASAFVGFAGSRIVSSLSIGPIIDYLSARQLFPFYLLPFGAGLVFAYYHPGNWSAFAYMIFIGITMGMGSNIKSALWAEFYGRDVIGTVRSLFSSLMVFSTALSPFLMGWAIDQNISMESIIFIAITTVILATLTAFAAFNLNVRETRQE